MHSSPPHTPLLEVNDDSCGMKEWQNELVRLDFSRLGLICAWRRGSFCVPDNTSVVSNHLFTL